MKFRFLRSIFVVSASVVADERICVDITTLKSTTVSPILVC